MSKDKRTAGQILKKEEPKTLVQVQSEYFALYDIEPYDIDNKIFKGKMLEQCRVGQFQNITDDVEFFFSRQYDESNDIDKVFTELKFGSDLTGVEFVLVPANKVRLFYQKERLIKLATGKGRIV